MCGCVFVVCLSWEAVRAGCGTRQRDRTCEEGGKEKDTEGRRFREGRRNDAGGRGTVIGGEETVL